jgi:hypothetical protein
MSIRMWPKLPAATGSSQHLDRYQHAYLAQEFPWFLSWDTYHHQAKWTNFFLSTCLSRNTFSGFSTLHVPCLHSPWISFPLTARLRSTDLHASAYDQIISSARSASHHWAKAFVQKRRVHFILPRIGVANLREMYHCVHLALFYWNTSTV